MYISFLVSSKKTYGSSDTRIVAKVKTQGLEKRTYVLRVRSGSPTLNIRIVIREGSSAR